MSFGAYTPRSVERAAKMAHEEAASSEAAGAQSADDAALHQLLPHSVVESRQAQSGGQASASQPQVAALQPRAARAARRSTRVKAREASRAAAVAEQIAAVQANGGNDSSEVDEIIAVRARKMQREQRKQQKADESTRAIAAAAAEAAAAAAAATVASESDDESSDEADDVNFTFGRLKGGTLQAVLAATGRPELTVLAQSLRAIDLVDIEDFGLLTSTSRYARSSRRSTCRYLWRLMSRLAR